MIELTPKQLARFFAKTKVNENGCIEWTASHNGRGYGQAWVPSTQKKLTAHRLAYTLRHGTIPDGMQVLHRCDNPKCVNADHLFLGTNADNMADMDRKGRRRPAAQIGKLNSNAKLTAQQVDELRGLKGRLNIKALTAQYGIGKSQIHRIVHGQQWAA